MYFKSIISSVALFFLAASSANAAPRESQGPHQILARSPHLSLRQATGDYGACTSICEPLEDKLVACGISNSCSYKQATDASLKAEMEQVWDEYIDACKDAGYPITGNTSITGSTQSNASPSSSSAAAAAAASASATASTGSTSSTATSSNGAIGLSSSFVSSVAIPVAALAVSALLL
ncbi:hypothetical protein FS837_007453 [Tulasnella sp. UAMH 9824]|nr:hypothetical protein FS837_007453 [Tulasnella sp. UAMH 9824]